MEVILIVAIAAVAVCGLVFAHLQAKKRREALAALARTRGLAFDPSADASHDVRFARFAMFRKGRSRVAYNTISGTLDLGGRSLAVRTGDFRYKERRGAGKNRRTVTIRLSYLIAWNPFGSVPETIVRREGVFDRLKGMLGFDDIDFESVEFSRRFHVSSEDKRFAYDLVDPRMMEFLLRTAPPAFELEGDLICVSDGRGCWDPESFDRRLDWCGTFFDAWPDHLVRTLADESA
ncbi:MAG: hypothetical protein CMJ27_09405 [Phycisphaerae bacterium]|nr:hypothetical protein [Phycisphaerae bacterium]OUX00951.1 MAG: hypothetical protein CBD91_05595 [Phycisphaeraceae bacterium TMED231]